MESLKTDRLSLMIDQLDRARGMCETRLAGLTDDEYLWEPAPGAWSIHRREDATSPRPYGPGEWVIDDALEDATLTEEQLDTTGFGQFPNGSDPDWPFASVLWWTNLEFVHHAAEMGLLRDLYRAK